MLLVPLVVLGTLFGAISVAAGTVSYAYDETGRLLGASYEDGTTITYLYDEAGNLLRRSVAAFTDTDGNGLDDDWESEHLGSVGADPDADNDGDGATSLEEFLAGTDPKDGGDFLRVHKVEEDADQGFAIEWNAVPGTLYRVQYTDTLNVHDWRDLPGDVLAAGSTGRKIDTTAPEAASRFYRVVVLP